jgi:hypothetical protein
VVPALRDRRRRGAGRTLRRLVPATAPPDRFRSTIAGLAAEPGCHWLSNEGHTVILQEDRSTVVPDMDDARLRGRFLLLHNGEPVAIAGPHGQSLEWLPPAIS